MNKHILTPQRAALAAALLLATHPTAQAVPYASSITNNAGTVSFRLNENADNIKIISNGGTVTNDLGPGIKGLTVTNLGIANGVIKVAVTRSAPAGYVQISQDGYQDEGVYVNKFEQPRGLVVNKNPATPSFGRIYVANSREATTAGSFVRTTFDGIYLINADNTVALDTGTTPRTAGWTFSPGNTASHNRLTIGRDDNRLYVADFSDPTGGLRVSDLDVEANEIATNVLAGVGDLGVGSTTHGSIYGVVVEGTFANSNLKVWTIDEDLTPPRSVWRYDVNAGPFPSEVAPVGPLSTAPIANFAGDLAKGGTNNYLYFSQNRSGGTDGPGVRIVAEDGTAVTDSLAASRTHLNNPAAADLLRNTVAIDLSPDGTTLAVLQGSAFGRILLVPLTNGIFNLAATNSFSVGLSSDNNRDVAYDAAGNLYVISTSGEWLRIFSKGGATVATTGTDGTFVVGAPPLLVSAAASLTPANEAGLVGGQFTLTRAGDTSGPLTINYTVDGTALPGTDYTTLPGSVTLVPGAASTNLAVALLQDAVAELTETVILTITASPGYGIGTGSATVSILDDEAPEITISTAVTNKLLESYAPSKANLQLVRKGLLTPALTVNLASLGTAALGTDFTAPATVNLAAGAANATIPLTPLNDQAYEGSELAIVAVAAGSGYVIGAPGAGYVEIVDDEFPAGTILFSDNFNTDSSAQWIVNAADPADSFAEFAYDYGTLGIPVAPGTTDGSRLGLRLRTGNTVLQIDGLSLSPLHGNFTGDYRLKFDMWINYNGPMPDGGPGSTQNFDAGVGTAGDQVVWRNGPFADGIWFTTTGDGADGNAGGDYTAMSGSTILNDDTGFYAAGTGIADSGVRNSSNPYYAFWGGQAAPAAQLTLFPNQTGVANTGNAGMAWHTVVISKAADTVKWEIDGITICTVTNDPGTLSTNIFVGYQDLFASGSLSDVPEMSFGLVDNLRVEAYALPSVIVTVTKIQIVSGNVEISFTAPADIPPTAFKLTSATTVNGTYAEDNTAVITSTGSGTFKATTAVNGTLRFYRIKF